MTFSLVHIRVAIATGVSPRSLLEPGEEYGTSSVEGRP